MDNIDKLFQENLYDHSITPSRNLWSNIEMKKNADKKLNKVFYLRIAAGFAIIVSLLFPISSNDVVNSDTVISNAVIGDEDDSNKVISNTVNSDAVISEGMNNKTDNRSAVISKNKSLSSDYTTITIPKSVIEINSVGVDNSSLNSKPINNKIALSKVEFFSKEKETKQWIKVNLNISAEQLLAMVENDSEKGIAEEYAGKLFKKISKETNSFITENNLPTTKNELLSLVKRK